MSIFQALRLSGPQISSAPAGGGGGALPNPNLLLWTEALDNAVWTASGITVTANAGTAPSGSMIADRLASSAVGSTVSQVCETPASTGIAVLLNYNLTAEWSRQEVTGTFDGLPYTFSVQLRGGDVGAAVRIVLDRSGGFLRAQIMDRDEATFFAWGAQLEQAATFTEYHARSGV